MTSLTLSGGNAVSGGAVLDFGTLNATSCTFQNNSASFGGAIYGAIGSSVTLNEDQFIDNSASVHGGAITSFGTLVVLFSTLTDNSSPNGVGGAVYVAETSTASLFFNTFTHNSSQSGGAIYVYGITSFLGLMNAGGSTFTGNTATQDGGAIHNSGNTTIEAFQFFGPPGQGTGLGASFSGNTAGTTGGAISQQANGLTPPSLTVYNSQFSNDSANQGGAIANLGGTLTVITSTLSGNQAVPCNGFADGGAIYSAGAGNTLAVTTIERSTLSGNSVCDLGGAVASFAQSQLFVTASTFAQNFGFAGGGIIAYGPATITNSTFYANTTDVGGSAIYNMASSQAVISYSTIYGSFFGSALGGSPMLLESTIVAGGINGSQSCQATIVDGGYNLDDGTSCHFSSLFHSLSSTACPLNSSTTPCLNSLASNGGPTQTLGVPAGSPVINKIPFSVNGCGTSVTTDQRGVSRPQPAGTQCGIGAVEHLFLNVPPSGTTCNGSYNKTFIGDITVLPGQSCVFVGGGVTGNVLVQGGYFGIGTAAVTGNVEIDGNSTFAIGESANIGGNLGIHDLTASSTQSKVCGATVIGNFESHNNAAPVAIGGTNPLLCAGNTIGGDLDVHNNIAATIVDSNVVNGNLTDHNNDGATQVTGNFVKSTLDCNQNIAITGGTNFAAQKKGQCAVF